MINKYDVEQLIDSKIKSHEVRVGIVSGIIGMVFILGNLHAFWLIRTWMN